MTRLSLRLLQVLALVLVSACSNSEAPAGSAQFAVTVPQALADSISRVTVTASASDFSPISMDLTRSGSVWTGTLGSIPAGPLRTFRAQAFDAANALRYDGSVSGVTITARETALVAILLQDVNPLPPYQNEAPIIDSVVASATTVLTGGSLNLTAAAHDPNPGDTLTYAWSATAGTFSATAGATTSWTAPTTSGIYVLTVTATDSQGLGTSANVSINVRKPQEPGSAQVTVSFNTPPVVSALSASLTLLSTGQATTVTATASDADGDTLTYAWKTDCAGAWTNATSRSAQFTPSALPGGPCNNCRLTVTVSDGRGSNTTGAVALCVNNAPRTNHFDPIIEFYSAPDTATGGEVLTYEVVASDPEGSALTFAWSASTGRLGTPTTEATRSRTAWTAPDCVLSGVSPRVSISVTNAFNLKATRDFAITGLPACTSGSTPTGSMATARFDHTLTVLPGGKVLAAGGSDGSDAVASAELYDPSTGVWSRAHSMNALRMGHTATSLKTGGVLIAGGYAGSSLIRTAEVYNPTADAWTDAYSMSTPRAYHVANELPNGKVLVSGGYGYYGPDASADVYDPTANAWSTTGNMSYYHYLHTGTLLSNGKVLVVGGFYNPYAVSATELYDSASGTWSLSGFLSTARYLHTATVLPDGKVLVVGGVGSYSSVLASAELYDPATGSWTAAGTLSTGRWGHQALLFNGKVVVLGGSDGSSSLGTAEQYDPATGTWSDAAPLSVARQEFAAQPLPNGALLLVGGNSLGDQTTSTAELYLP